MELPANMKGRKLHMLQRWANLMAGRYGHPVYLCGSALHKEDPRDYDIRIRLPDKEFARRYELHEGVDQFCIRWQSGLWNDPHWKWAADNLKQTKHGWKFCQLNIDFQIYPAQFWKQYENEPRLRLDHKAKI